MAYVDQDRKKELAVGIKAVCKKYNVKATISVRHHSTLVITIREGIKISHPAKYFGEYEVKYGTSINPYHYASHHAHEPEVVAFLGELLAAANKGNFDKSDIQTDYFHVGWYVDVNFVGALVYPHGWKEVAA